MFKKKIKVHIYKNEISLVLKALNEFRNEARHNDIFSTRSCKNATF